MLGKRMEVSLVPLPAGAGSAARPEVPRERIAQFCRGHRIRRLALFGSVLPDAVRLRHDLPTLTRELERLLTTLA